MNIISSSLLCRTLPLLFRVPDRQSPIVSLQNPVLQNMQENFKSLLAGSISKSLHTPLNFFSFLPHQHVQLTFGLLQNLGFQIKAWKCLPQLGLQQFQSAPFLQSVFQNTLSQGVSSPPSLPLSNTNQLETNLKQNITRPEPAIASKLQEINQKRSQKGQAPIDFQSTTREIEGIMNNPALSDKDKKGQIAQIRKKLGLSKKDMRTLFTQRLKGIYENAAQQIRVQLANTTDPIEKQRLTSLLQSYESKAGLYNSMFKSFWSKLGGFFKKVGGFFKTVASGILKVAKFVTPFLKFIPGIGQIASVLQTGLGKVFGFLKEKISSVAEPLKSIFNTTYQSYVEPYWNQSKAYLQKHIGAS